MIMEASETPKRVSFYSTNRCNLRCKYCFTEKYRRGDMQCPDVSMEVVDKAFEVFGGFDRVMLGSPGEPMMSRHFVEIVSNLVGRVERVNMTTNGTYIRRLQDDVPWKDVHKVVLTIHDITPEGYRDVTGTNLYDEMIWALDFLVKNDIGHTLNFVVDRNKIERIEEFIRFAAEHGAKEMALLPLLNFKDFERDEEFFWANSLTLDDEDCVNRINEQRKLARNAKQGHRLSVAFPRLVSRTNLGKGCRMVFDYIAINGRGDIAICCRGEGPRAELGNLRDGKALWTSPVLEEFRRKVLSPEERFPKCRVCHACYELGYVEQ